MRPQKSREIKTSSYFRCLTQPDAVVGHSFNFGGRPEEGPHAWLSGFSNFIVLAWKRNRQL